jgi:hypothetical protein
MDQQGMKNGELPEYPVPGPFGGIQSELPPEMIGQIGFADASNMMFRLGRARVRPEFVSFVPGDGGGVPILVTIGELVGTIGNLTGSIANLGGTPPNSIGIPPSPYLVTIGMLQGTIGDLIGSIESLGTNPAPIYGQSTGIYEPWIGVYGFYDTFGDYWQVANTPTQMYYYTNGGWVRLFGPQHGTDSSYMSYAVVGEKLYFSQGIDSIWVWDGLLVGPVYAYENQANPLLNAPAAAYLFEMGNHLVACNLITQGSHAYQRVQWSGAGDGRDWTSFDSGQTDLYNDLGPITGCIKLFQYGYIWQQFGVNQLTLTGNAAAPFSFNALSARSKGLVIPRSLAANGESTGYYVGQDNVYSFDGTTSQSIGDAPLQGRTRLGARSLIFGDISVGDVGTIFGFVSTTVNGNPYNAYWLVIPNVSIWIYHIDDMTWTKWSTMETPNVIGNFLTNSIIRIEDLIGTIAQQNWSPATLTNGNPFPSIMIGCYDGTSLLFDFTGWSEEPWSITTGQMDYGDPRHENSTKKLRLTYKDNGPAVVQVLFTNEEGQISLNAPTSPDGIILPGKGAGTTQKIVLPVNLPSIYATMKISGEAGVPFEMSSYAPIYSQSGEVKNAI